MNSKVVLNCKNSASTSKKALNGLQSTLCRSKEAQICINKSELHSKHQSVLTAPQLSNYSRLNIFGLGKTFLPNTIKQIQP